MENPIVAYVRKGCKTCGRALDYLRERDAPVETIDLFDAPLTTDSLRELFAMVGKTPSELLRPRDRMYRELDLKNSPRSDERILELMVQNPGLIKRPILVRGKTAVLGVKPEAADKLLD